MDITYILKKVAITNPLVTKNLATGRVGHHCLCV